MSSTDKRNFLFATNGTVPGKQSRTGWPRPSDHVRHVEVRNEVEDV